jgi:hypothetical protein
VECAGLAGQALDEDLGVSIHENGHALIPISTVSSCEVSSI